MLLLLSRSLELVRRWSFDFTESILAFGFLSPSSSSSEGESLFPRGDARAIDGGGDLEAAGTSASLSPSELEEVLEELLLELDELLLLELVLEEDVEDDDDDDEELDDEDEEDGDEEEALVAAA